MYTEIILYINQKGNIMKLIATLIASAFAATAFAAEPTKAPATPAPAASAPVAATATPAPQKTDKKAEVKPVKSEHAKDTKAETAKK